MLKGWGWLPHSPDNFTAYRWSPVSTWISINTIEERPKNRNLEGVTVNAPGEKLANSFNWIFRTIFSTKLLILMLPFIVGFTHWVTARFYSTYCVPEGAYGLFITLFNTANPICTYTLTIMEYTRLMYSQCWLIICAITISFFGNMWKWIYGKDIYKKNAHREKMTRLRGLLNYTPQWPFINSTKEKKRKENKKT